MWPRAEILVAIILLLFGYGEYGIDPSVAGTLGDINIKIDSVLCC
jgi:hypothetical protein